MWGGTKVPGGNSACHEKELSLTCFGVYVWPKIFHTILSMSLPALVTPAFIAFMGPLPVLVTQPSLARSAEHALPGAPWRQSASAQAGHRGPLVVGPAVADAGRSLLRAFLAKAPRSRTPERYLC